MTLKIRYQKFSEISGRKFREILKCFSQDFTASDTAELTSISVRSVNTIFLKLRTRIIQECEKQTPFEGVVELDESYFGHAALETKEGVMPIFSALEITKTCVKRWLYRYRPMTNICSLALGDIQN